LLALARLLRGWRYPMLDAQIASPHLFTLGAIELPRDVFCARTAELAGLEGVAGSWQDAFARLPPADLAG